MGIYVAQVVVTNARLVFMWTLPNFLLGAKMTIFGKIFDKVLTWRLTVHKRKEYLKLKTTVYSPQIRLGSVEQSRRNVGGNRGGVGLLLVNQRCVSQLVTSTFCSRKENKKSQRKRINRRSSLYVPTKFCGGRLNNNGEQPSLYTRGV